MQTFATVRLSRAPLAAFAAMGVLWGSFAADLPDIKVMLNVDEARLGLLLFMTPIAAMLAMMAAPVIGRSLGRFVLPVTVGAMALAFVLPGQVAVWWMFPLALLLCGATTGATDVLMNARVSALEAEQGRPLMNLCHAGYSFGYAGGAIGTGLLRDAGHPPWTVMATMALMAGILALLAIERDGRISELSRKPDDAPGGLGMIPVIGGGIVLIAFMTENAAENWSALHIEQTLHGSPAYGAAGPAVLALTMGLSRLVGHGLSQREDPIRILLGGSVLSALGAMTVAMATGPMMAYVGFIIMGIGASVIAPTAFTLVGRYAAPGAKARAVARATMLGYFGYFIGPPALGFVAGSYGLRAAFVFASCVLLVVWVLAPMLARQREVRGAGAAS